MKNLTWNELAREPKTETNSQIQGLVDLEQSEMDDVSGGVRYIPWVPPFQWKWWERFRGRSTLPSTR